MQRAMASGGMEPERRPFGMLEDGRHTLLHTLRADGIVAEVADFGATLVTLEVPDRDGRWDRVILGMADATGYAASSAGRFLGATIGRVANRISGSRFTLDGQEYRLDANDGQHHLHGGGQSSFDAVLWQVASAGPQHLLLRHVSPNGDAGYPGTLDVEAEYRVASSSLAVTYRATTDRRTPVNMTHHPYFNLAGERAATVGEHDLRVAADAWTPVDDARIPLGTIAPVESTPFDLRRGRRLADGIAQLEASGSSGGYDHNLWLEGGGGWFRDVAELSDPMSGRRMVLATDQPCVQVYTGGGLAGSLGRDGRVLPAHAAVCIEPQYAPDSVNHPGWPSIILEPGNRYEHRIVYRFAAG